MKPRVKSFAKAYRVAMQISKAGPIKVVMSQLHVTALSVLHLQSKSLYESENSKNKDKLLSCAAV